MTTLVRAAVLIACSVLFGTASAVSAQCIAPGVPPRPPCVDDPPPLVQRAVASELLALGLNMAMGGLTAGIRQAAGDGSFLDGFWRGAVGGAGTYAGKRIATGRSPVGGVVGRGVAAAGASVTRNAADGLPMFDRLTLPVGFVRLQWRPGHGAPITTLDIAGLLAVAGVYMTDIGASLDIERTFTSGAPVFTVRDWTREYGWHGRHVLGAVLLRGDGIQYPGYNPFLEAALRHERVHVLQYDQVAILSEPVDRTLLRAVGAPAWLVRRIDLSVGAGIATLLHARMPSDLQFWEAEAHLLAGTRDLHPGH